MPIERMGAMRRSIQGALAAAVLVLAGCNKLDFKEFTSKEGKFSILMPGEPERKTTKIFNIDLVMYGIDVRNGAYAVGYADFPPGTPLSLDGAVQGISGT